MTENDLFKTLLSRSMALCSKREYCTDDIKSRLKLWGLGEKDSERIITILAKENFISDERYARAFVNDKFICNKWGKVKISAHLKAKRIPQEIISEALNSIDDETYVKTVRDIISARRGHIRAKNQYDLKGRLLRYGLSKGYESGLLYDILNDLKNDPE